MNHTDTETHTHTHTHTHTLNSCSYVTKVKVDGHVLILESVSSVSCVPMTQLPCNVPAFFLFFFSYIFFIYFIIAEGKGLYVDQEIILGLCNSFYLKTCSASFWTAQFSGAFCRGNWRSLSGLWSKGSNWVAWPRSCGEMAQFAWAVAIPRVVAGCGSRPVLCTWLLFTLMKNHRCLIIEPAKHKLGEIRLFCFAIVSGHAVVFTTHTHKNKRIYKIFAPPSHLQPPSSHSPPNNVHLKQSADIIYCLLIILFCMYLNKWINPMAMCV